MLKHSSFIYRENNLGICVAKSAEIIAKGSLMAATTFIKSCPLTSAIPLNNEDLKNLFVESAKLSMQEELLLATVDIESENVLAISISLNLKSKAKQSDLFENWKWVEPKKVNVVFDLFSKVSPPVIDYPNPVYGFALAVTPDLVKNKFGTKLYSEGLKYWKSLGYKSRFTEATSRRSQSIVLKQGGEIIKSYEYDNYYKDSGFRLGESSYGESLAHMRTLF